MTQPVDTAGLDPQTVLLIDDDVMITEGLAAGLERGGRTVITCNDLEAAELIVERFKPSHVVADVRLSGAFGFEGLDLIRFARRHAPESRVILMSGDDSEALQLEASERGAVAFLRKPFEIHELNAILDLISPSLLAPAFDDPRVIRMPLIDDVLSSAELRPFFQPIVALGEPARPIGFESVARFRTDSPLRNPEILFKYAMRKQRTSELELVCIAQTIEDAQLLAGSPTIFLNVHPDVFRHGLTLPETLRGLAAKHGLALARLVVEITEQAALPDSREVFRAIDGLRELGVRLAYDDVGVAYSHLPMIGKIRPSFLKISQAFGGGFESDDTKTKIVKNILALGNDFGCKVILEGIEEPSTACAARELGIPYGQGFLFGRPADASTFGADLPLAAGV